MSNIAPALTPESLFQTAVANRRLAVTGATGWIGSVLVRMAIQAGLHDGGGRLRLLASTDRQILVDGVSLTVEALSRAAPLEGAGWIVVHGAFLGRERSLSIPVDTYVSENEALLQHLLRWIAPAWRPRLVFTSSGAAYGEHRQLERDVRANPYGALKLRHEAVLTDWALETKARLIVPRIFNIGGPCSNKTHLYALSSLIQQAKSGEPLQVQARGVVWRSYVQVEELAALLVALASEADTGVVGPFDTVGLEAIEIEGLARRILAVMGRKDQGVERHLDPDAPPNTYLGEGQDYAASLVRFGLVQQDLDAIIASSLAQSNS